VPVTFTYSSFFRITALYATARPPAMPMHLPTRLSDNQDHSVLRIRAGLLSRRITPTATRFLPFSQKKTLYPTPSAAFTVQYPTRRPGT